MHLVNYLQQELPKDTRITRYVDIHSFLYFITQSKLRFARLDSFEDINEGFTLLNAASVASIKHTDKMKMAGQIKERNRRLQEDFKHQQQNLFACCWYMGEKESVAMWNLYSNPDSVAIRFYAAELIELVNKITLKEAKDFSKLMYGLVEYIDLSEVEKEEVKQKLKQHQCTGFVKDNSFSHEQEFRLIAEKNPEKDRETFEFEICLGQLQNINFQIISHPKMEDWKIRNILNVLKCYKLKEKYLPSTLALKNVQ